MIYKTLGEVFVRFRYSILLRHQLRDRNTKTETIHSKLKYPTTATSSTHVPSINPNTLHFVMSNQEPSELCPPVDLQPSRRWEKVLNCSTPRRFFSESFIAASGRGRRPARTGSRARGVNNNDIVRFQSQRTRRVQSPAPALSR